MKKIIFLCIIIVLLTGCRRHNAIQKINPHKPYETVEFSNFKSTGKGDAAVFQTMGLDYLKQKDWMGAQNYLSKAVKSDPKLYWSWYCLGLLNIDNQGGYDCFKKSIEAKPDFPTPYFWMAYYHCRAREDQQAINLFKKYIELARGNPEEEDRVKAAEEVLKELESGKEGEILAQIRKSQ